MQLVVVGDLDPADLADLPDFSPDVIDFGRLIHWKTPLLEKAARNFLAAADAEMLPSYDYLLEDDTMVEVGRARLHTITTPGHTPGSICFRLVDKPLLFSGDTLFPGGPGATKFEGGDFPTIIQSIDRRLFTLPPDTIVLPGHGDDTTIGAERPHLQEWIDRGW